MIVEVERVAHGGVCVAHAPDGRVVFVRHALPGEQVRIEVTEERSSYLRADAVEVLRASPSRVVPPCPYAGPGRCGGCDWQHVALDEQRRLKAAVVREQLLRLAGLDVDVEVEAVPGDRAGLGWRTRLRLAVGPEGRAGFHKHRSHLIEPIDDCLIAAPGADVPSVVGRVWPEGAEVNVDVSSTGERALSTGTPDRTITERAAGRDWQVPVGGFWQVHPGAADTLVATVRNMLAPRGDETLLDLYAGVGLFAGALAPSVRTATAVESDRRAAQAARANLADLPVTVAHARVDRWLRSGHNGSPVDLVVLDPPRKGAGRDVVTHVAALRPRAIAYVAC
ncbi:MAG: class I SAM-dependent RNA methyltransferase, partial [Frankiales bacterium]|nr:class I SAM-dependent RNA methyltransferase [Frankiales bacterium]